MNHDSTQTFFYLLFSIIHKCQLKNCGFLQNVIPRTKPQVDLYFKYQLIMQ